MKTVTPSSSVRFSARILVFLILMITWLPGFSQSVGINSTGAIPNPAAGLDVDFPDKGILIPRVALTGTASSAPLAAHIAGMMIYNTATTGDVTPGFYCDNGTNWVPALPAGNSVGGMLFWNGSAWVAIPAGQPGQYLSLDAGGVPVWGGAVFATITTTPVSAITSTTATSGGTIISDGGSSILSRGICYATTPNPTTANLTATGGATSPYTCSLSGLSIFTTYYVRAYSVNNSVTSYGNQISFTTLSVAPTLAATTVASGITTNSAVTGGNVTATGGGTIVERGICYATTTTPTIANTKVVDPSPGTGIFTSNMTGLTENSLYYVRSYATNSQGQTGYGAQITLTTLSTLTTTAITAITTTGASSGGTIATGGSAAITSRGVCWSTTAGPTTALSTKTSNGTGTGTFTSSITGLSSNITYYVRAYSINAGGTSYGNELTFTTPAILTSPMSTVTQTTAISGGTIASNVASVTARGVCWNTNPAPTIADFFTSDGTGTGVFVSNLSGLTNGTTYYLRSYFTDGGGTTIYGDQLSFTTGTPKAIGDALAGGKVIYVDISGQHGLIGALTDQGSGVSWGCSGITLNIGIAQGGGVLYAGLANTNTILAAGCAPAGTAAQLCAAYTAGGTNLPGITNWYLPSHDELQILCDQRAIVNLTVAPSYAGAGVLYWSSTEYNASIAYAHYSLGGIYDYNNYKSATYYSSTSNLMYVRAVRAF